MDLIAHDSVHPTVDKQIRMQGTRTVLMYDENEQHQCMICTKISNDLVRSMQDIFSDGIENGVTAMFYTIFRLPDAFVGVGQRALSEAINYFSQRGVQNFYTLSPIPSLSKYFDCLPTEEQIRAFVEMRQDPVARFHLGNGASLHAVNFNADISKIRQQESWGAMVNYRYSV